MINAITLLQSRQSATILTGSSFIVKAKAGERSAT